THAGAGRAHGLVAQAQLGRHTRQEVLDHDIGAARQVERQARPLRVLQLDRDPALAPVDGGEGRAHAVAAPPGPEVVAAPRALELDHVGTEVSHEGGAVGAGDHPGEVENADAAEHAAEYNPGPLSVWYRSGGKP